MDPEACLRLAQEAFDDDRLEDCEAALRDYYVWRAGGGFGAVDGVARVASLRLALTVARSRRRSTRLEQAVALATGLSEVTGRPVGEHLAEAAQAVKERVS